MKREITTKEIIERTGIKYYSLEHLIRSGRIKAKSYGKGNARKFDPDVIEKIKEIQTAKGR